MERRHTAVKSAQVKATKRDSGEIVIDGYAAVFYDQSDPGTEYRLYSDLYERIAPQAFSRALAERQDVRALYNHDPHYLLGRSVSGTLALSADSKGLKYEATAPDTQSGRDVATLIQRGDLSGSSFSFIPKKVEWMRDDVRNADIRTIIDVDLIDVGPVTFPAYESTTTGLRSEDGSQEVLADRDRWRAEVRAVELSRLDEENQVQQRQRNKDTAAVRMRLLEIET